MTALMDTPAAIEGALAPAETDLVRQSFRHLRPYLGDVATLFFLRLWELQPSLRTRLPGTFEQNSLRLVLLLEEIVAELDRPAGLQRIVHQLAALSRAHQLQLPDHAAVRSALLWALGHAITGGFPAGSREAWSNILGRLHRSVITAAGAIAA